MITSQSIYGKTFNRDCPDWTNSRLANLLYLKNMEDYYNIMLKVRGFVFLKDIYEKLGFPITKASLVVGWFYDENNAFVDNRIDFDLPRMTEGDVDIPVDFNVDGDISEHFD